MNMLEKLRKLNPGLPVYSVEDPEFRPYGRILECSATEEIIRLCPGVTPMPEGSAYKAGIPELEEAALEAVAHELRGDASTELGCCWGHSSKLNCLEYHRASEFNIAVTDLVLLLGRLQDVEAGHLPTDKVVAFYVPQGKLIEVYATTLHFCPCEVSKDGFRCIVILPKGTNLPLTQPRPETADGRLLWAQDKWLIAHAEAPAVSRGAFVGLDGVNIELRYEE